MILTMDWIQMEKELQSVLKKKRYEHTLGVRYTAASLAMCHGCDLEQAQLAALLHDCAKGYSEEELLHLASKHNLEVNTFEKKAPQLLHAKVGAYIAEHQYQVKDEAVLNAIRYHTTGKPDMTPLEKIIFIADYIEPNRKMLEGLPQCRKMAFEDLDLAMYQILKNTLSYLQGKNSADEIDDMTQSAFGYYESIMKNKEKEN